MRCTLATLALAAVAVAKPVPAGVSSAIAPDSTAPAGCSPDYSGTFQIQVVKGSKRDLTKRQSTPLTLTLSGGVLTDSQGRTGYIASNNQFQFDDPPQAGAIYTSGFSVCQDGSLALGSETTWYQCLSGDFYNLYDESTGAQCSAVHIVVIGGGSVAPSTPSATASGVESVQSDGQPTGSAVATPICQISDGQPQVTGCVTQISDGQIQAPTATAAPVTQISDGQIQATTGVVTQISDGQIQATSAAVVTQISDGQIQATSAAPSPCTQIVDGQPQCPGSTGYPVPSYGANTTIASATPSVVPATGAGAMNSLGNAAVAVVGGVLALAFL